MQKQLSHKYRPNKSVLIEHNKIEHQIQNEGCLCDLCHRISLKKMRIVKSILPNKEWEDEGLEKYFKKDTIPYYVIFLKELHHIVKEKRSIRFIIPEIAVFQKGTPIFLLSKKREYFALKLIRNREKLNFYQIKNFFLEGYLYHNRENKQLEPAKEDQANKKEKIKNQCIVIARYTNNHGQLLTPNHLNNLFKSNQRAFRTNLLHMQTIVSTRSYEQLCIKTNINQLMANPLYPRAKTEVRIIIEEVKSRDLDFIPEKEEIEFEEMLKKDNFKTYLQYLSLKFILLHSFKTQKLIDKAVFKYAKSGVDNYYFVDLIVHEFGDYKKIWGIIINDAQGKMDSKLESLLNLSEEYQNKNRLIQNTENVMKLERIMNNGYQKQKDSLMGKRIQRLQKLKEQKKSLLQISLPDIKKSELILRTPKIKQNTTTFHHKFF